MRFIKDSEYIRNSTPMTKEEIRAVIMAKLSIEKDECIFDIGAGTGSISIQSALYAYEGKVYAVECDTEAVEAIRQNIKKFNINNIEIIEGRAPDIIKDRGYSADKIFIGGSSGEIVRIVDTALNILKDVPPLYDESAVPLPRMLHPVFSHLPLPQFQAYSICPVFFRTRQWHP